MILKETLLVPFEMQLSKADLHMRNRNTSLTLLSTAYGILYSASLENRSQVLMKSRPRNTVHPHNTMCKEYGIFCWLMKMNAGWFFFYR